MTAAEIKLMRDLIRTIRSCARGNAILGPSALNLCSAVEVLLADHERTLKLLDDVREWIRGEVGSGSFGPLDTRTALLTRIDAEIGGEE